MLFAAMLMFKGSNQSSDEKAQAFQAQRGQQGVAEGLEQLNSKISVILLPINFSGILVMVERVLRKTSYIYSVIFI